jgi:hypothetical protein
MVAGPVVPAIFFKRSRNSVLAFANVPARTAESPPTYRGDRGTHCWGESQASAA